MNIGYARVWTLDQNLDFQTRAHAGGEGWRRVASLNRQSIAKLESRPAARRRQSRCCEYVDRRIARHLKKL
jgi:hypothetical protein